MTNGSNASVPVIHSPELTTARLRLRAMTEDDIPPFISMRSDDTTMRFIPLPLIKTTDGALTWMSVVAKQSQEGSCVHWVITDRQERVFLGTCGLFNWQKEHHRAETGYMLLEKARGRGIATEAMKTVLDYGFRVMALHSVEAVVMEGNLPSARLLDTLGFSLDVVRRDATYWQQRRFNEYNYSLLAHEFHH